MPRHRLSRKRVQELYGVDVVRARGPRMQRLTAQELEDKFGVTPVAKLVGKKKRLAKRADLLFVDMYMHYGISSIDVFRRAAERLHSAILHNMSECPEFVLAYMEEELSGKKLKTSRDEQAKRLRARIARDEAALRRLV